MKKIVNFQKTTAFEILAMDILGKKTLEKNFLVGEIIPPDGEYPFERTDDLFNDLSTDDLKNLNEKYIIIDSMFEGWSTVFHGPFIECFYASCYKHDIDYDRIVYVTCNLIEDRIFEDFAKKNNVTKIKTLCLPYAIWDVNKYCKKDVDTHFNKQKHTSNIKQTNKYVLSLSYRNRRYRTQASFMLATSAISKNCLISHNCPVDEFYDERTERSYREWKNWKNQQPTVIDNSIKYNNTLHAKTLFNIVNETFVEDWQGTSRELSEKTFVPMTACQPLLIFGQPGSNTFLSELGFELYTDWFDLSFDDIPDPITRYKEILKQVEDIVKGLNKLPGKKRQRWKFKNEEVIRHNYQNLKVKNLQMKQTIASFLLTLAEKEGFEPSKDY